MKVLNAFQGLLPSWRAVAMALLVSAILATGGVTADGQVDPSVATFYLPVDVPLVNVEVTVTDRSGAPISGLTEADFEIFEDGRRVVITHFFAPASLQESPDEGGAASTVPPVPHQELYLALYVDDLNTDARRRAVVLAHLREFLEQPLPLNVKTMLVRFNGEMHVVSDFSNDTDQLLTALDETARISVTSPGREEFALFRQMQGAATDQRDQIHRIMEEGPRPLAAEGDSRRPPAFAEPDNQPVYHSFLPEIHAVARSEYLRTRASIEALERFVGYLSGVPGRKAVVWVGNLDLRPGESLFLAYDELFPGAARRDGFSPMMEAQKYDMTLELRDLLEVANSQRVSFYTVSALSAGLERISSTEGRGRDPSRRSAFTDIWGEKDSLDIMSGSTGGRTLADNLNLDEQLTRVSSELGVYYSLGYTPPSPADHDYHTIEVRVRREGAQVRHRQGYRRAEDRDPLTDRTVAAATLGIAENTLGITLEAQPQEANPEGTFLVPVMVSIPLGDLVLMPGADDHSAEIALTSVVRDVHGRLSDVHTRVYPIRIANDKLFAAAAQNAEFVLGMILREGAHRIAVSVRDNNSMVESTAFIDVVAGAESTDRSG